MASHMPYCEVSTKMMEFAFSVATLAFIVVLPADPTNPGNTVAWTLEPIGIEVDVLSAVKNCCRPSPGISTTQAMSPGLQPAVLATVNVLWNTPPNCGMIGIKFVIAVVPAAQFGWPACPCAMTIAYWLLNARGPFCDRVPGELKVGSCGVAPSHPVFITLKLVCAGLDIQVDARDEVPAIKVG